MTFGTDVERAGPPFGPKAVPTATPAAAAVRTSAATATARTRKANRSRIGVRPASIVMWVDPEHLPPSDDKPTAMLGKVFGRTGLALEGERAT